MTTLGRSISMTVALLALANAALGDVTLYTTSGELVRGTELTFDSRGGFSVDVTGQPRRTLAASEVAFVDLGQGEALDRTGDVQVVLRNGDVVRGSVEDGNENDLTIRAPIGTVKMSINGIDRLLVASNLPRHDADDGFVPVGKKDTVYKKTSKGTDVVSGTLEAFTKDGLVVDVGQLGKYPFKLQDIVALALVPQGKLADPPKGSAFVTFRDGSRLTGPVSLVSGGNLDMDWVYAKRLRIPLKHVASMTFTGEKHVFLSDLEPKQVVQVPPFGGDEEILFPWRKDRSVGGAPLQVGGLRFAKGLGMHARSEITWALDGTFASFTSLIGIDDETRGFAARGSAIFRLIVDGQKKFESQIVAGGSPERVPPVDVRGAKELRLVVDFADEVGAGARGDWGNAILVRP